MAKIKGVGAPTRKTQGGIGDIYTDKATGKQYKCEGSYGSASHETEYYWRGVKDGLLAGKSISNPEPKKVETPVAESVKEDVVAEPVVESEVEESPEEVKETKPKQSKGNKRTNYAAAYNENK